MNSEQSTLRPGLAEQIDLIEELCDRFEELRRAGDGRAAREFLRAEGYDPETAPSELLRKLEEVEAAYPASPTSPRTEAEAFPLIPGYEILGKLGEGGMGVVYKAVQLAAARVVALKVVRSGEHASAEERSRFKTEAEAVARSQNAHVVQVFEVREYAGVPYFSMEFCAGGSLADKLRAGPTPPDDAAELVEKIAIGVQAAHAQNVIHRDLKPSNVLLSPDGKTPKVTDFGLARLTDSDAGRTVTGQLIGTPSYMAPEQAAADGKPIGPLADVWALGAILYECLTGRPPFKGATHLETLELVKGEEPVAVRDAQPRVPRDLETICHKCLEKEPASRYTSAADLVADLRAYLERRPIRTRPVGPLGRLRRWVKRRPAAAALVVTVLAALSLMVAVGVKTYLADQRELRRAEWDRYERNIRDAGDALAQARYGAAEAFLRDCPEHLRDTEWHVLRAACRPNVQHRLPHSSQVSSVVADLADGRRIATGGLDGRVILWDAKTGREITVLQTYPKKVNNLASGCRGRYLAAASDAGVSIWDVAADPPALVADRKVGGWVALAQNAELIALGGSDRRVTVWNLSGPAADAVFTAEYPGIIHCLALSPSGNQLAVGGMTSQPGETVGTRSRYVSLRFWALPEGRPLDRFRVDYRIGYAFGLAWGNGGDQRLVSASNLTGVVWDTSTGEVTEALPGYETAPTALAFDQGGRHLAASFANGSVKVWAFEPGPRLVFSRKSAPEESGLLGVSFDPTGELLAYSQGRDVLVERWKKHGGVRTVDGRCFAYSPDGRAIATGADDGTVRWLAADGRELSKSGAGKVSPSSLAVSPDGARVAVGRGKSVWLWEPGTGREIEHHTHPGNVLCVAYSRAGNLLASSDDLGNLQVRDAETGTLRKALPSPAGAVASVAFSPDGRRLAAGDLDGRVTLWDTQTWARAELVGHGLAVTTVAFSPDGRWLASGSADQTVRLWEVAPMWAEQGRESRTTLRHRIGVAGVAFSADRGRGARVVSLGQDGVVRFWAPFAHPDRGGRGAMPGEFHRELLALAPWQAGARPARGLQVALNPAPDQLQIAAAYRDGLIELRDGN